MDGQWGYKNRRGPTTKRTLWVSERGVVLILVLWIVVVLSMAALSLSLLARTEAYATFTQKEEIENRYLAEAGIRRGILELFYRQAHRHQQLFLEGFEPFQCDGRSYTADIGDGHFLLRISDESGKINLNALRDGSGLILKNLLVQHQVNLESADIIVDSILDWKDKDNLTRLNGAEEDYYRSLPKPYRAKNADFDSLEELLFVRGMTRSILYSGHDKKGIFAFCTVHSPMDKINIHAASVEVLKAIPGMTEEILQRIQSFRDLTPGERGQSLAGWLGGDFNILAPFVTTTESNVYSLEAIGYKNDRKHRYGIRAIVILEGTQKYRIIHYQSPAMMES